MKLPTSRHYQTVGGLLLQLLGRVPEPGAHADVFGWRWEVVDMDGWRIDRVLVGKGLAAGPPAPLRRPGSGAPASH